MQNWADKFVKWFEEEIADSDKPLDEHWEVEIGEENGRKLIRASSPYRPYSVLVEVGKRFATLKIKTGVETAILDSHERLKIYRSLLLLNNKWRMAKYALVGEDEEIVIITDLDLVSLSRDEFSDALTVTLFAMNDLVKKLNLEDIYEEAQLIHVADLILQKAKSGKSKEEIVSFIAKTYKLSKDIAEEIVSEILKEEKDSGMYV